MSKLVYSFIIAILLHIIVLVLSTYIKGIENQDAFVTRNLIDVQFGSSGGTKSASSSQSVKKTVNKKTAPLAVTTKTAEESPTSTGSVVGNGNGNGNGNTNTSGSFESSIVSYEGPAYPKQAQLRGLEGVVRVRVEVSAEGLPEKTTIIQSSGHESLDRAATSVVPRWRFQKSASPYAVEKNIVFKLKG